MQGRSTVSIAWLIIITLITLMRAILQTAQSPVRYPLENIATQTARADLMSSAIETVQASNQVPGFNGTASSSSAILTLPTPRQAPGDEDLRPAFVPGSWEWEQLHRFFPQLTTSYGLSADVSEVLYDPLQGYQIKTRSSGEYWLYVNRYDQTIMPAHFPPTR